MHIKKINILAVSGLLAAATVFPLWDVNAEAAESDNKAEVQVEETAPAKTAEAPVSKYADKIVDTDTMKPCLSVASWKPEIKMQIEDFLGPYVTSEIKIPHKKNKGPKIKDIPYAILNIDETAGINKAQEQVLIYQLETLSFAMTPEKFAEVIRTGMTDQMIHSSYGADNGQGQEIMLSTIMDDAVEAYTNLYKAGAIKTGKSKKMADVAGSEDFKEFGAKMLWLYHAVNATQGADIAKPWAGYLYTGMTPYDVYSTIIKGLEQYGDYVDEKSADKKKAEEVKKDLGKEITLKSPQLKNKVSVSASYHSGINSTKQVAEMVKAIQVSGLDVWVVSSANYELVRACLNYYHVPPADGILAMRTKVDKEGRYVNEYNYKYHPATYYKDGMISAVKKEITSYYNAKVPAIIAEDKYNTADEGYVDFCAVYPATRLKLYFENGEASEAIVTPRKSK